MPLEAATPQRIPGRLRSHSPLQQPNYWFEPLQAEALSLWEAEL